MSWRTWKMVEDRMRNAIIVRAGAAGHASRFTFFGSASRAGDRAATARPPPPGGAAAWAPRAVSTAEAAAAVSPMSAAERLKTTAEYNAQRDAYFARNCVE